MTKARQSAAEKARQSAEEKARLDALLKEKVDDFISRMQAEKSRINFDHVPSDRLLIIEALNDWSGGALSEGGDVLMNSQGDDPACATAREWDELVTRIFNDQRLIYPVTAFVHMEDQEGITFYHHRASYRLQAHIDGSRMSAVNIAREKHITDVDACHQLWLMCATEDCMAYLQVQMDLYSLDLTKEDGDTTRRIVAGFLQNQMSPGQVWNAMWRTVKHAAAMSKRQYYNSTKAAALIPKHLDKVLTQAMGDSTFESYDRIVTTPVGGVLMLFRTKFGVDDTTPGRQVREALAADALMAPPSVDVQPEDDEPGERTLIQGTFYFNSPCEGIDSVVMSCFQNVSMETTEIDWPSDGGLGRWAFTADENFFFNSDGFIKEVLKQLGIEIPVFDQATCSALPSREEKWEFEKRYCDEMSQLLMQVGVSKLAANHLSYGIGDSLYGMGYPLMADEIVSTLNGLPIVSGLAAIRLKRTTLHSDCSESQDYLTVEHFNFDIPEELFEPTGRDADMVKGLLSGDMDSVARMLADATNNSIRTRNWLANADLLEKVAQHLFDDANRLRDLNALV
jgi:hypothetical protein